MTWGGGPHAAGSPCGEGRRTGISWICVHHLSQCGNLFLSCPWSPVLSADMSWSEPGLPESTHGCCSDLSLLPTSWRPSSPKVQMEAFHAPRNCTWTSEPDLGQAKPEQALNKQSSISFGRFLFMLGPVQGRDAD